MYYRHMMQKAMKMSKAHSITTSHMAGSRSPANNPKAKIPAPSAKSLQVIRNFLTPKTFYTALYEGAKKVLLNFLNFKNTYSHIVCGNAP